MLLDATGTQVRWDTPEKPTFTRTRRLRFGAAYHFTVPRLGKGAIGADFETDQADLEMGGGGGGLVPRVGAEYWLFNTLALRGGWNGHGLSAGAGLPLTDKCHVVFCQLRFQYPHLGRFATHLCFWRVLIVT